MPLLHGDWYRLPDGFPVRAECDTDGSYKLIDAEGTQLFVVYSFGIRAIRPVARGVIIAALCDLDIEDLHWAGSAMPDAG
jgi:hypothetical protein